MADGTKILEPDGEFTTETTVDSREVVFGPGDTRDRQRVALAGAGPNDNVEVDAGALRVRLDEDTRAALENVVVSGQVSLDPGTLAALENIAVTGEVALDAQTIQLLAQAIAGDGGNTVALDATTLAALESVFATVQGSIDVANLPGSFPLPQGQLTQLVPRKDGLTDGELRASPVNVAVPAPVQTRIQLANGTPVDGTHPLPVAASFSDAQGIPYSSDNPVPVDIGSNITLEGVSVTFDSHVSQLNSTQTPLAANETFLGQWEDVVDYAAIAATYFTDAPSAFGGAGIEFSIDGVNPLPPPVSQYSYVPANTAAYVQIQPAARYFRVRFTNGPVAQTFLQSQIVLLFMPGATTQTILAAPGTDATVTDVVKAYVGGRKDSGLYEQVRITDGNAMRVHDDGTENRYGGGKKAKAQLLQSSGDNVFIVPAAGHAVKVYWVYAITDPDSETTPLVSVKFGADAIYVGFAISHWEVFTGPVDVPLVVNLGSAAPVAVTVHYEEVVP